MLKYYYNVLLKNSVINLFFSVSANLLCSFAFINEYFHLFRIICCHRWDFSI